MSYMSAPHWRELPECLHALPAGGGDCLPCDVSRCALVLHQSASGGPNDTLLLARCLFGPGPADQTSPRTTQSSRRPPACGGVQSRLIDDTRTLQITSVGLSPISPPGAPGSHRYTYTTRNVTT